MCNLARSIIYTDRSRFSVRRGGSREVACAKRLIRLTRSVATARGPDRPPSRREQMTRKLAAHTLPAACAAAIAILLSLCLPAVRADVPASAKLDAATAKPSANIEKIAFEKETLDNGLDVIYAPLQDGAGRPRAGALSRRQPRRAAGPAGLRPHVRAHDVPRLGPREAGGAHEADRHGRRGFQRVHQLRPDDVRQHAAEQQRRNGPLPRSRPHGELQGHRQHLPDRAEGRQRGMAHAARPTRRYGTLYQDFLEAAVHQAHSYRWTPIGDMDQLRKARQQRAAGVLQQAITSRTTPAWSSPATSTSRRPSSGSASTSAGFPRARPSTAKSPRSPSRPRPAGSSSISRTCRWPRC